MVERIEINPDWPWARDFRFNQGIRIGDTVHVSGQVGFDPDGNIVGGDDMEAQARQVFANVRTILEMAGATMNDVVKITAFLTDLDRYAGYSAARAEAFPDKVPTSTAVATPALVFPGLLVEVEAVAEIGSG
jgi:enamine deaminase RidA (YjgF/YER057c/UK114 family)